MRTLNSREKTTLRPGQSPPRPRCRLQDAPAPRTLASRPGTSEQRHPAEGLRGGLRLGRPGGPWRQRVHPAARRGPPTGAGAADALPAEPLPGHGRPCGVTTINPACFSVRFVVVCSSGLEKWVRRPARPCSRTGRLKSGAVCRRRGSRVKRLLAGPTCHVQPQTGGRGRGLLVPACLLTLAAGSVTRDLRRAGSPSLRSAICVFGLRAEEPHAVSLVTKTHTRGATRLRARPKQETARGALVPPTRPPARVPALLGPTLQGSTLGPPLPS